MVFRKLLTALASVLLVAGCTVKSEENQLVIYQIVTATQVQEHSEFSVARSFSGVLVPARSADIAFEFGGTLQVVMVDEGDRVAEGELLAKLDTALLSIERRQLQAQLTETEANLRLSKSNLTRHSSLESDGFASQQRRDELEAGRDAIRASIQRLHAALDGNQVRQEKSHLYAPFDGVIGERYQEDGSSAVPGKAVFKLLETGRMEAHIGVPRKLAITLAVGDIVSVEVGDELMEGTILAVGAELKARSHTAKIRIQLPSGQALAGSLVQLRLMDSIAGKGFPIPQSALTASMRGLWRVYVITPAQDGLYRVEARDLQLRYAGQEEAYVEGGLSDGDLIVTKGVQKVVPGQLVEITAEDKPS